MSTLENNTAELEEILATVNELPDGRIMNLVESADYPGCFYRTVGGVQEWLNPPLIVDVEYRTTEKWGGKPVYVQAINTGTGLSYGVKRVTHGIQSIDRVIRVIGTEDNGLSSPHEIRFYSENDYVELIDLAVNATTLFITFYNKTTVSTNLVIAIWYIKL